MFFFKKKNPCTLIYWDEEMTERELSCEGFLLCASMKEIRYEKLVSIDGKYEHIQKIVGDISTFFYLILFILIF